MWFHSLGKCPEPGIGGAAGGQCMSFLIKDKLFKI